MRNLLIGLLGLGVAYYAYGAHTFSQGSVQRWIADHEVREMSGSESACDDYADDVEVSLTAENAKGRWEVEGGKNEMCGYIKQAAAVFTVLQAETQSTYEDVSIQRSGFPWRTAVVTFKQRTDIRAQRVPAMVATSDEQLTLKRTLSGLKIIHLEATSNTVRQ